MAIVEKSKKTPKHWEEFAVLRLSARELAGIAALMAADSSDITQFDLYYEIDNLLGKHNNYNDPIGHPDQVAANLDAIYGEI